MFEKIGKLLPKDRKGVRTKLGDWNGLALSKHIWFDFREWQVENQPQSVCLSSEGSGQDQFLKMLLMMYWSLHGRVVAGTYFEGRRQ